MNSDKPERSEAGRFSAREIIGYVLSAAAVWLTWEVVKTPFAQRGPPSIAVRLAPASPEVLRRAAEAELAAGRVENASVLAQDSLQRAPFNARALRVRGLAEARNGRVSRADDMLTLAGNWSLRDDPAHAWLVEHRLRRGDYGSAFAHADTLVRRRADLYPRVFALLRLAAMNDQRALGPVVQLMAANPPWRSAFLEDLEKRDDATPLVATLAIALQRSKAPLNSLELQQLYADWTVERRFAGLRYLREQLGRPTMSKYLQNGEFNDPLSAGLQPFAWLAESSPGISSALIEDDVRPGNMSMRIEYDGFGAYPIADQVVLLPAGRYRFTGQARFETKPSDARLIWKLRCAGTGEMLLAYQPGEAAVVTSDWQPMGGDFTVPARNCEAQKLTLDPVPGERRTHIVTWFDKLAISSIQSRP